MTFAYDSGTDKPDVKARDNIARTVIRRYRSSVNWQGTELVGGKSLRQVLKECYDQANGILSPKDRDLVEALKVDAYVNLTAMKTGVVQAFLLESLVSADELPWVLKPTPIPELSASGIEEALAIVKEKVFGMGFQGDLQALVNQTAAEVFLAERDRAEKAAKLMERKIFDQTVEGGWREAMSGFLYNFVTYPYGIIHGPVPTRGPRLAWNGDKLTVKNETYYRWEAVSPWDFWYSPDSQDTQRGTGVCLRKRHTRRNLLEMASMKSYFTDQVRALLVETDTKEQYNFKWMSPNPDQPDDHLAHWADCTESIDALQHYGRFSGRELESCGLTGLDRGVFYDASVTVIGGYTVQCHVFKNPAALVRPVFTASFYRTADRIPNSGIAQRLRDVERMYLAAIRYLMYNAALSSAPIAEMDASRLSKHMAGQDLSRLTPGSIYLTESDLSGSAAPALRSFAIPSNMGEYARLMGDFIELSHLVTNIPAALHGTAVGTGANRTFRGMATLQANAVKSIQAAVGNIDEQVFLKMGEYLFNLNMLYEKDMSVKGDCKVYAQGVIGLLAKEIERNNAMDLLQILGTIGASAATPAIEWALQRIFNSMGMPPEIAAQVKLGGEPGGTPDAGPPPLTGDPGPAPLPAGPEVPPGPLPPLLAQAIQAAVGNIDEQVFLKMGEYL
ncbi:MAG: hypothetical protein LBQ12_14475, partial [Deltaproteobacteria bacterium]|nr:hypothetical protein [Deltaproteobacteria bacterium]